MHHKPYTIRHSHDLTIGIPHDSTLQKHRIIWGFKPHWKGVLLKNTWKNHWYMMVDGLIRVILPNNWVMIHELGVMFSTNQNKGMREGFEHCANVTSCEQKPSKIMNDLIWSGYHSIGWSMTSTEKIYIMSQGLKKNMMILYRSSWWYFMILVYLFFYDVVLLFYLFFNRICAKTISQIYAQIYGVFIVVWWSTHTMI